MNVPLLCPEWLEDILKVTRVVSPLTLPSMHNRVWRGMGWVHLMIKKLLEKQILQQSVEALRVTVGLAASYHKN